MSFFSDLFHGNFGNLGQDLAPSNILSDAGTDISKFVSNPLNDVLLGAGIALPFLAPELLGGLGAAGTAIDVGGATAGDLGTLGGVGAAGLGAGADPTAALLSDAQIAALQASPGASAFASTAGDTGTAFTMGAGGDLSPAEAAAQGASAIGGGAPAALPAGPAAPTTNDFFLAMGGTPQQMLPGTGLAGNAIGGGFGAAPGGGGFLDSLQSTFGPLNTALKTVAPAAGLAGLGLNLYQGAQQQKALNALATQEQQNVQTAQNIQQQAMAAAQPMLTSGTVLSSYIANNTLPPEFQAQLDQITAAGAAGIRQGYASRNPNDPGAADPTKNSALAQDLQNNQQQSLAMKAQIEQLLATAGTNMVTTANQLLAQGLSATTLGSQIPMAMAKLNMDLNTQISNSISNFAAAMNGQTKIGAGQGITINTGTGTVT
jgi:hypothetical protein